MVSILTLVAIFLILAAVIGIVIYLILRSGGGNGSSLSPLTPPPSPTPPVPDPPTPGHVVIINQPNTSLNSCDTIRSICSNLGLRLATEAEVANLVNDPTQKYCDIGYAENCTPYVLSTGQGSGYCATFGAQHVPQFGIPCPSIGRAECATNVFCFQDPSP